MTKKKTVKKKVTVKKVAANANYLRKAALSKLAYDCAFQSGFESGVKNQQEYEHKNKWYRRVHAFFSV